MFGPFFVCIAIIAELSKCSFFFCFTASERGILFVRCVPRCLVLWCDVVLRCVCCRIVRVLCCLVVWLFQNSISDFAVGVFVMMYDFMITTNNAGIEPDWQYGHSRLFDEFRNRWASILASSSFSGTLWIRNPHFPFHFPSIRALWYAHLQQP